MGQINEAGFQSPMCMFSVYVIVEINTFDFDFKFMYVLILKGYAVSKRLIAVLKTKINGVWYPNSWIV